MNATGYNWPGKLLFLMCTAKDGAVEPEAANCSWRSKEGEGGRYLSPAESSGESVSSCQSSLAAEMIPPALHPQPTSDGDRPPQGCLDRGRLRWEPAKAQGQWLLLLHKGSESFQTPSCERQAGAAMHSQWVLQDWGRRTGLSGDLMLGRGM